MLRVAWIAVAGAIVYTNAQILPISVDPTQRHEGNDGPWSTFQFQVGSNNQTVRLLPSTYLPFSLIVDPNGCDQGDQETRAAYNDCVEGRGGIFNCDPSTGCAPHQTYYDVTRLELLNKTHVTNLAAEMIYDRFSIGYPSTPDRKSVAGLPIGLIDDGFYTWTGLLGLDPRPGNFSDQGAMNTPQPSFLSRLRNQSSIASLSYSYTAGAYYRSPPDYGSLILGGMDQSRVSPNSLNSSNWWTFADNVDTLLMVKILQIQRQEISTSNNSLTTNAGSFNIPPDLTAIIDSSRPYFYLPQQMCDDIAKFFGGKYSKLYEHYLISEAQHTLNLRQNLTMSFQLTGATLQDQQASDRFQIITLPYRALSLNLTYPQFGPNPTESNQTWSRYIPIKPTVDERYNILGRAILQEAVITVDYDRRKFLLAPQRLSTGQNLTAIVDPASSIASSTPPALIAGIIAGVVGLMSILTAVCLVRRRRRRRKTHAAEAAAIAKVTGMIGTSNSHPVHGMELDGLNKQPVAVRSYEVLNTQTPTTTSTMLHAAPVELDGIKIPPEGDNRPVIRVYYEMDSTPPGTNAGYGSESQSSQISTLNSSQFGTNKSDPIPTVGSGAVSMGVPRLVNIPPSRLQPALTSQNPIFNSPQSSAVAINQTPPLPPPTLKAGDRTPASPIPPTPLEFYGGFRRDGSSIPTPIAEESAEPMQDAPKPTWVGRALPVVTFTPATPPTPKRDRKASGEWI